ncbi:hypothetical protein ACN47E_000221 [Coniothyrium glycines]
MTGDWNYGFALKIFVWGYLLGGLTLLPAALILAWFLTTSPVDLEVRGALGQDVALGLDESQQTKAEHGDDSSSLALGLDEATMERLKSRTHVPDVCAGYFAVCREYVPGGVNGKPPDRTTPAGAVVSAETPSVYQSMYRSIFDRNKTASPSIEASNTRSKKARNVFYVVLRLGHLMLYDNEDQLEVRHVISLAYYKVDVYAGGGRIPEGELWIKRNCIRLRQSLDSSVAAEGKSFYLFSDNCSEKEDFYHAMLQAQEHHKEHSVADNQPVPLKFETPDLVKLVQQLHASEENLHTRWINALIGRVFLALYKTSEVKEFIAAKINKKIARVPKPALISSVQLRKVDMGTLPPFITNPKLKELTVDGDLIVEADVSYKGNFRIEISATVRIDLGTRFKAREVTLVLATVLKRLDGHILIRVKPPPSNRLWITFETPPRMEFSLEPIVSSRQITYGPVLRAIESRIREVVNETLVLPNWDDMPFTNTLAQTIRGGIWSNDTRHDENELSAPQIDEVNVGTTIEDAELLDSMVDTHKTPVSLRSTMEPDSAGAGVSTSNDLRSTSVRPRPLRSSSSAAQVQLNSAHASAELVQDRNNLTPTSVRSLPLASPIKSPMRSEIDRVAHSPESSSEDVSSTSISATSTWSVPVSGLEQKHARVRSKDLTPQEIALAAAAAAEASNLPRRQTLNQTLNSASNAARNWLISKQNARNSATESNNNAGANGRPTSHGAVSASNAGHETDSTTDARPVLQSQSSGSKSQTEPVGRGQPLPPPGTPLPLPKAEKRQTWAIPAAASTFANLAKRKPMPLAHGLSAKTSQEHLDPSDALSRSPPPHSPAHTTEPQGPLHVPADTEEIFRRSSHTSDGTAEGRRRKSSAASSTHSQHAPPIPKRRQRQPSLNAIPQQRIASHAKLHDDAQEQDLLVVEAPLAERSGPSSPVETESTIQSAGRSAIGEGEITRQEGPKMDPPL